jgi:hypothetical protein
MAGGETKIPLSKYLMENGREDWVDEGTTTRIRQLLSWNSVEDAPGFGDTSEEEDSEEEEKRRREGTLRSNEETRQRKRDEEDSGRKKRCRDRVRRPAHHGCQPRECTAKNPWET